MLDINTIGRYKFLLQYYIKVGIASDQKGIGKLIGYNNPSAFSQVINGKKSMPKDFTKKLLELCPDISENWLLYGEGEMLNNIKKEESGHSKAKPSEQFRVGEERLIPFYDVESTGGYNGKVSASDNGSIVGYIHPGGWFDGNETAAIRHVGDSMVEYPNGCVLAVRKVLNKHLLVYGRNYVIETSEYRVTKRVQRGSSADTIMLYSSNSEKYDDGRLIHEPFEVSFSDILNIFSVLGYIVNQSGEFRLIKPS